MDGGSLASYFLGAFKQICSHKDVIEVKDKSKTNLSGQFRTYGFGRESSPFLGGRIIKSRIN